MFHTSLLDHLEFSNSDMNQVKRKLRSNQSDDKGIKKLLAKVNIDQET